MDHMPTTTPSPTAATASGHVRHPQHRHLAAFRPGGLLRIPSGTTFRVSKDATRVHFAQINNRRNVVHFSSHDQSTAVLPDPYLRILLQMFASMPAWASAHRCWRAHLGSDGIWTIALELRGSTHGRLQFPPRPELVADHPGGHRVDMRNIEAFHEVVTNLWAAANTFEKDTSAPADLTQLRDAVAAL